MTSLTGSPLDMEYLSPMPIKPLAVSTGMRPSPAHLSSPAPLPAAALATARALGLILSEGSPLIPTLKLVSAAASRDCPVHIRGESGSGKELLARFLHASSPRAKGPWVPVNCGAIPPHL